MIRCILSAASWRHTTFLCLEARRPGLRQCRTRVISVGTMQETVEAVFETRKQLTLLEGEPRDQFRALSLSNPAELDALVSGSAHWLEFAVAVAALNEAIHELGIPNLPEALRRGDEIVELASKLARQPVVSILEQNSGVLSSRAPLHASQAPAVPLEQAVRVIASFTALCPIDTLQRAGAQPGMHAASHRCLVAYEWLQAFVRRHSPEAVRSSKLIGRAYAEGRLSIDEAAVLLVLTPSDAVDYFEKHGFCRTSEVYKLSDEQRQAMLADIRRDRLARGGQPRFSQAMVARDVIASERIEGVDARAWVRRA